ncbi:EamA family transporter [Rhodocyclus tenuis]|uniref:EamA family transporter n=1 Tax=Rhodocyclus tenuis TaxID=1066 RepID=A0A6L5JZ25_RHOTE|nr:EamA family transporter [Rhodocyclus gracilis]
MGGREAADSSKRRPRARTCRSGGRRRSCAQPPVTLPAFPRISPVKNHPTLLGVACALGAGLAWGLVFVIPLVLIDYPPVLLAVGRYVAFGLIALPLALHGRAQLRQLGRADWWRALELAAVGNLAYYALLASAIQRADAPLPTVIIGTLPIVIAIAANYSERALAWRRLVPSLLVIAAGIVLVNREELARLAATDSTRSADDLRLGALLAVGAVLCWTWYPLRNARWLQARPQLASGAWATAQGLATLPLALLLFAAMSVWPALPTAETAASAPFAWPLGPTPGKFMALMLLIGLLASWLGTLLWNRASQLLPTALSGQFIVFETVSALAYAFIWRGEAPAPITLLGIALLLAGVVLGARAVRAATP